MTSPDFWGDQERAQSIMQESSDIKGWTEPITELEQKTKELGELEELTRDDEDARLEMDEEAGKLMGILEKLEFRAMLDDPDDWRDAILTIHPGAGGTESQDWAQMLLRMYLRWTESQGFETRLMDNQPADEAGIKSATVEVKGKYAYGYLKAEAGVHRLVRLSPFDANHRRHTSFASVFVYPEVEEKVEVEMDEKDLRVDTFRSGGAGGQHVNKVSSAVRITHVPTGIVVQCQSERSQFRNKENAMKVLRGRLYLLQLEEKAKAKKALEDAKPDIAWGSQIRSYVFHPYNMVKDHRTGVETSDVDSVMDGTLDQFIHAYLKMSAGSGK
jgi:peptide chain release factor 2